MRELHDEGPAVESLDVGALEKLGVRLDGKPLSEALYRGKVRDILDLGSRLLIYTTDRISAFDKVLDAIPAKGEILQGLSLFWFEKTKDIIRNHIIEEISPRALLVKKCKVVPVEVVVRGYLTGSAFRDYEKGKTVSGIHIRKGMKKNERFESPILTPTTKAEKGMHDEPVSRDDIVRRGIVEERLWNEIEDAALRLFRRGTEIAGERGLILVDTKYEFGIADDGLYVVDEIHTQDSSRYWYADSYDSLFAKGEDQRELDKEYFRKWLMARGYMGDGTPPEIPDDVKAQVAERYMEAYSIITGRRFAVSGTKADEELARIARRLNQLV